jgi:hypothetical protein
VISTPYTKESVKNDKKEVFSSRLANNEMTTRGYKTLTLVKCTTIMIIELAVTSSLGSSQD